MTTYVIADLDSQDGLQLVQEAVASLVCEHCMVVSSILTYFLSRRIPLGLASSTILQLPILVHGIFHLSLVSSS